MAANTHTLVFPIVRDVIVDGVVTEQKVIHTAGTVLTFRRSKGRDLEAMARVSEALEKSFLAISQATGLPMEDVRDMDGHDITECGRAIVNFMKAGLPT